MRSLGTCAGRLALTMAWGLFLSANVWAARHPAPNFEPHEQQQFVLPTTELRLLWDEAEFTEGPAPMGDGTILFSDIGDTIFRFNRRQESISAYRHPSGKANGLMFDSHGRLIACEGAGPGGNRRLSATDLFGKVTTLADNYQGKRFNSPNDLAIAPNGTVYFTDPRYSDDHSDRELDFEGVFLVDTAGEVKLATRDVVKPNGIAVEPRGRVVYVADNSPEPEGPHQLLAFRILADGTLSDKHVLFDFGPARRGIDGMTLDIQGNVYAAAGSGDEAGIYIFSRVGRSLAFIPTTGDPTNCVFGIRDEAKRLYITTACPNVLESATKKKYGLMFIDLTIPGYHVFPKSKP